MARLRATAPTAGGRDFLLKTELSAGHGGVSGRYQAWRDRAFTNAWMLDRMGLADAIRPHAGRLRICSPENSLRVPRGRNSRRPPHVWHG